MLSVIILSVIMLSVIMLSVIMLSVIMLSTIMLSVIMHSAIMLIVFVLNVIMLSVEAPLFVSKSGSLPTESNPNATFGRNYTNPLKVLQRPQMDMVTSLLLTSTTSHTTMLEHPGPRSADLHHKHELKSSNYLALRGPFTLAKFSSKIP
jgi:hypothetical protein